MNATEAKLILTASRAQSGGAPSEELRAALACLENDPELQRWYAREQEFDHFAVGKLREVAPPVGLREKILASAPVAPAARPQREAFPLIMALAAVIILFLGISALFFSKPSGKDLPGFAIERADQGFTLAKTSPDLRVLTTWLAEQNKPIPVSFPEPLSRLDTVGCRTFEWEGQVITVICFSGDKTYHLFVARKSDFNEPLHPLGGDRTTRGKWSAIAWDDAEKYYVLVSDLPEASLEKLL